MLSGSMEPAFYRGDILFLNMGRKPFRAGEVVVFNINGRDIPIVHRIIKVHEKEAGTKKSDDVLILTKACVAKVASPVHLVLLSSWKAHSTPLYGMLRAIRGIMCLEQRTVVKAERACPCRVTITGGMTGPCTIQGRSGFIEII